jgi:dedicated sortase system histidine kinase
VSRRRLTIRAKVAMASLPLLFIPYVGHRYVVEMEQALREGLEEVVAGAAVALAGALHDRPDILGPSYRDGVAEPADLQVHALDHPTEIDGYAKDWAGYEHLAQALEPAAGRTREVGTASVSATLVAAKHGRHLYLLVEVSDDVLVFGNPQLPGRSLSDQVRLRSIDARGIARTFVLSSLSPGWVGAYELQPGDRGGAGAGDGRVRGLEPRIRGAWQRTATGYALEVKAPLGLVSPRLAVDVVDVDGAAATGAHALLSSAAAAAAARPGRLLLPSTAIEGLIRGVGRADGRRIRVVDAGRRVVARGGSLVSQEPAGAPPPLLALLLRPPSVEGLDGTLREAHLSEAVVGEALSGHPARRWRAAGEGLFVVAAAEPVWIGDAVGGAVLVEETTLGILTTRRQALVGLLRDTVIVFTLASLVLLLLASRIATRLARLRDQAEGAIDTQGRVVGELAGHGARDEIGDLGRAFSGMLERLRQYNQYLENLGRRLSHELRTPIAVTRSSLDALELDRAPETRATYLSRAREGLDRLDRILTRMSEATRLEHALTEAEREPVDLAELAAASAAAYDRTWPDARFVYRGPPSGVEVLGSADLLAQLIDKLAANAHDFHAPGTTIAVEVAVTDTMASLAIENRGPPLPEGLGVQVFEPMVSARERSGRGEPHLGLGLYIARLVAVFHGGRIRAENVEDGVRVTVELPLAH